MFLTAVALQSVSAPARSESGATVGPPVPAPRTELEEEIVRVDEDLLTGALEDRDRPAARRDRRLEVLVEDGQVGELQAAAAQVEEVRPVLEARDRIAEEASLGAPASGPGVHQEILGIVEVEPELVAPSLELVIGRAAEEPIGPAAAVQR